MLLYNLEERPKEWMGNTYHELAFTIKFIVKFLVQMIRGRGLDPRAQQTKVYKNW